MYARNVVRSSALPLLALATVFLLSANVAAQKGPQSRTGAPLKGVDVKLGRPPGGSPAARTTTDGEGKFTFPVVPAGEYILTLELKKPAPNAQAERSVSASNGPEKFCYITLTLPGGEKIERGYDLSENKSFDPASDPTKQSASKAKLETFIVKSDGVNPLNGTIVKSKSNISNN